MSEERFLLCRCARTGQPVFTEYQNLASGSAVLEGRTGGGKSTALACFARNLCGLSSQPVIAFFDGRGEVALANYVEELAARFRRTFYRFTTVRGLASTKPYNPLLALKDLSTGEYGQALLRPLGILNALDEYAEQFFTLSSLGGLLKDHRDRGPAETFRALSERFEKHFKDERDMAEVVLTARMLAEAEALNPPPGADCITARRLIDERGIYFGAAMPFVDAITGPTAQRLFLFELVWELMARYLAGRPVPAAILIDEAKTFMGRSLEILMNQVRVLAFLVLSTQSLTAFELKRRDLTDTILTNARLHMRFDIDIEEARGLQVLSGEKTVQEESHSVGGGSQQRDDGGASMSQQESTSIRDVVKPRAELNDILAVNRGPGLVLLTGKLHNQHLRLTQGLPVLGSVVFPTDRATWDRLAVKGWPSAPVPQTPTPAPAPRKREAPPDPVIAKALNELDPWEIVRRRPEA